MNREKLNNYVMNQLSEKEKIDFQDDFIENIDNPELDNVLIDYFFGKKNTINFRRWISVAAAVIFIAGGILLWNKLYDGNAVASSEMAEVTTGKGYSTTFLLPDSTEVILHPESKLRYSKAMKGDTRDIYLEGEAHLQVTKNASRPFIVHCNNMSVKVLGTIFNVSSYASDKKAEVTLYKGKVVAESNFNNNLQEKEMQPGEHIIINKENGNMTVCKVPAIINQTGENLLFINEPLGEIIKKLERRYNINIEIEDSVEKSNIKMYAIFINDESLIDMLKNFSTAANVQFTMHN